MPDDTREFHALTREFYQVWLRFHPVARRNRSVGSSITTRAAAGTPKGLLNSGSAARRSSKVPKCARSSRSLKLIAVADPPSNRPIANSFAQ